MPLSRKRPSRSGICDFAISKKMELRSFSISFNLSWFLFIEWKNRRISQKTEYRLRWCSPDFCRSYCWAMSSMIMIHENIFRIWFLNFWKKCLKAILYLRECHCFFENEPQKDSIEKILLFTLLSWLAQALCATTIYFFSIGNLF